MFIRLWVVARGIRGTSSSRNTMQAIACSSSSARRTRVYRPLSLPSNSPTRCFRLHFCLVFRAESSGDVSRMQCPVTVTVGSNEAYFGGASTIYSFAQQVHATVFSFWGNHLHEPKDTLKRLASFVADASKPAAAAPASPRRRSPRRKSKSPSSSTGSPSPRRRAGGGSKTNRRKRGRSDDSRRAGKKSTSPKRG